MKFDLYLTLLIIVNKRVVLLSVVMLQTFNQTHSTFFDHSFNDRNKYTYIKFAFEWDK